MLLKLAAIFAVIGVGWGAGRTGLLGEAALDTLTRAAFYVFTPALLFRTMAGISLAALPWPMLAAYFLPTLALLLATAAWQRRRNPKPAAGPAVRGLAVTFSNTVQLGVPVVTALFGAAGLALHLAIVSLQALVLLTTGTILAETAGGAGSGPVRARVLRTARHSVVHPVVLPILLGLAFHATGLPLPGPADDVLATLAAAVVPVSLVTIGLSLQHYGVRGSVSPAAWMSLAKLGLHPAAVFAVGLLVGLSGLPLVVAVLCAALPTGANVLIFAGRYDVLRPQVTATIVIATTGFAATGSLWLMVLSPRL